MEDDYNTKLSAELVMPASAGCKTKRKAKRKTKIAENTKILILTTNKWIEQSMYSMSI